MKAVLVDRLGGPEVLRFREVADPVPAANQVLVRVRAASVNFADVMARRGGYHLAGSLPFVPGIDALGTVAEVGQDVTSVKPGERVIAFCQSGGYAELTLADERLVFPVPDGVDDETAAAMPLVGGTSCGLLKMAARFEPGESVLIHAAAGGVGSTLVQMAREFGASRIFATVGSDAKKERVLGLGAHEAINYRETDYAARIMETTGGSGVDVVFNPLGGESQRKDAGCLADFGRLVVFGNITGEPSEIPVDVLYKRNQAVVGFSFGHIRRKRPQLAASLMERVLDLTARGKLRFEVGKTFELARASEAHAWLESRKNTGKILLTVDQ